ncbi:hypothetical protein ACFXG6_32365 [Streptomyces roseus]|uniref:hypothetical protein n=1 Tax=Streptomyces roseus TaxID=66430 RepID=UPI003695EE38
MPLVDDAMGKQALDLLLPLDAACEAVIFRSVPAFWMGSATTGAGAPRLEA